MTTRDQAPRLGLAHRLLLKLPAETAHSLGVAAVKVANSSVAGRPFLWHGAPAEHGCLAQSLLGLDFRNPVGLAAGFDKDGEAVAGLAHMGFGWIEVGTVTPRPQPGNPKPRLYRHRQAASLENRMGFNNSGGEALRKRLGKSYPAAVPLGVNLGKNKDTPNERAIEDYLWLLEKLSDRCDYFVINVSSPNTPGLRDLQESEFLSQVLGAAAELTTRPVFVKLSPDLETRAVVRLVVAAVEAGAAGAVLTNTTARYDLLGSAKGVGGLSGEVLTERSFELLEAVARELFGRCLLVSVGGIGSGREAYRRLRAGASLVQLYTSLVYQGPQVIGRICSELQELLARDGIESVADLVGLDRK